MAARARNVLVAAAVASALIAVATTAALAQTVVEVEVGIVGFGDKDCRTGSDRLKSSSAEPFEVETCLIDNGSPLPDFPFTALVEHADDTEETIDLVTESDGSALFLVVPVDAGITIVRICVAGDCGLGEVEFESDNPPRPVPVASYHGPSPGSDMGPSEFVGDDEDDFGDPSSGGAAGPGEGDPAMDIHAFRYLGNQGGVAMWEFRMHGDTCAMYESMPAFSQFSVFIQTPESGSYGLAHRLSDGELFTFASSEGAPLDMVDLHLEPCAGDGIVIFNATGVHVAENSTFRGGTWLSRDPSSSGLQDSVTGTFVPAAVTEEELVVDDSADEEVPSDETATDGGSTSSEEAQAPLPTSTSDDGGSFPIWVPFVVFGVAIGGYFLYRSTRADGTVALTTGTADVTDADLAQYKDGDLGAYTDVYTPTAVAAGTAIATSTDEGWSALLHREETMQERFMGELESLFQEVVDGYKAYHEAIGLFKEKFVKIMSGSTGLQGYMQQWVDTKKIAGKQDLAFAIVTLVWGLGSLGLKAVRWLRTPKAIAQAEAGAARALGSADDLAAGETLLGDAATIIDEGRGLGDLKVAFQQYADELGMTADEFYAKFPETQEGFAQAAEALINAVATSRGWHGITENAAQILNRLLVNGRSGMRTGGASIDPSDLAALGDWASAPGFWNDLLTTGGMFEEGAMLFYSMDDVRFLKALLESGGDLTSVKSLIGPAQQIALKVADDIPGFAGVAGGVAKTGIDVATTTADLNSMMFGSGPITGMDLSTYTDQFGGWAGSVEEGFAGAMLDGVWGIFTSPFETYHGITMTIEAQDRYIEFLEGHGTDLEALGGALNGALGALQGIRGTIDRANLDDPTSPLGGARAGQLNDLVGEMDDLLDGASDEWRAEHGDEIEARKAHIAQKIADSTRMLDGLQDQLLRLEQMYEWLDGLRRNPDGTLRQTTDLWSPELLIRLGAVDLALKGIIGSTLQGGSIPNAPAAPSGTNPNVPDPFSEDYKPFEEFDDQSAADYESEWQGEMDDAFTGWDPDGDE